MEYEKKFGGREGVREGGRGGGVEFIQF
jgi:hypothetical protein